MPPSEQPITSVYLLDSRGNPMLPAAPRVLGGGGRRGGVQSILSGVGGPSDKQASVYYVPTTFTARELEMLYVESWAASKFIDIPVDDMLSAGRQYVLDDARDAERLMEVEYNLDMISRLSMMMKAARLFGTGLCAMMVADDGDSTQPLDPKNVREGDLKSLLVFSQYDTSITSWVREPRDPHFGQPEIYELNARIIGMPLRLHHSRVLRIDGRRAVSTQGWLSYTRDWGISELLSALKDITNDMVLTAAVAQLTHEANIGIVKTAGFREALTGETAPGEPTIEQVGTAISVHKSVWNTMFLDATDSFERVAVGFGGLAELMDRYAHRLAAIAGIPRTRFLSETPGGFFGTETDNDNYARHIAGLQGRLLTPVLRQLDRVLVRSAGIKLPEGQQTVEYKWNPLQGQTEKDRLEEARAKVEVFAIARQAGAVDDDEIRARLSGDPLFGVLEPREEVPVDGAALLEVALLESALNGEAPSDAATRARDARRMAEGEEDDGRME